MSYVAPGLACALDEAVFEQSMDAEPASEDLADALRARAGEMQAFDRLIGRYQGTIAALLFRFCPQRADLEDLVQETFVRAFRGLHAWRQEKPFEHWLKRIAINVGRDFWRRSNRIQKIIDPDAAERLETMPDRTMSSYPENTERAQRLLARLGPDDRLLLTLQYLDEMPLTEVAELLGWSHTKTRVRSFRARRKLRRILEANGYSL